MEIDDIHSHCIELAETGIPQIGRKQKAQLYAHGLKTKMNQAKYALDKLRSFNDRSDRTTTTTATDEPSIKEQVEFYCDTFWAFLYSSLDVLAQYINQVMKLGLSEKDASFKSVLNKVESTLATHDISICMRSCRNSRFFANLDKYRNCSTHRRQIYIEEVSHTIDRTDGYITSTGDDQSTVVRTICDDPLAIRPTTNQSRGIPEYLDRAYNAIINRIEQMATAITVVR